METIRQQLQTVSVTNTANTRDPTWPAWMRFWALSAHCCPQRPWRSLTRAFAAEAEHWVSYPAVTAAAAVSDYAEDQRNYPAAAAERMGMRDQTAGRIVRSFDLDERVDVAEAEAVAIRLQGNPIGWP